MTTFYVYLMPYMRGGKVVYYCGYTNNPARREREHQKETRYHWSGRMHVIAAYHDNQAEAMRHERHVKHLSREWKKRNYKVLHADWLPETVGASP